jgi:hypothetical protein
MAQHRAYASQPNTDKNNIDEAQVFGALPVVT